VAEDGHGNFQPQGINDRSYRRRLPRADLSHQEEEVYPIQPRVLEMRQSFVELLAAERTRCVGKEVNGLSTRPKWPEYIRISPFGALPLCPDWRTSGGEASGRKNRNRHRPRKP
jgi:hypothetical protein